jgi:thiamine-phosphate pyrophosphorylase
VTVTSSRLLPVPRLHVLTDDRPGRDPLALVDAALTAGARCVQVRVKSLTDRAHHALAAAVAERCRAAGAVCIVNDRVDIALAAGATGVHLGADDLPVAAVRRLAGDRLLVGGTARDPVTARRLVAAGADYLGVGPVHGTTTKSGLPEPIGLQGLAAVAEAVDVPVIAIAGITIGRVPEVLGAGAHGVAVIGAVSDADDRIDATRRLLDAVQARHRPGDLT